jgi:hypothetical protein
MKKSFFNARSRDLGDDARFDRPFRKTRAEQSGPTSAGPDAAVTKRARPTEALPASARGSSILTVRSTRYPKGDDPMRDVRYAVKPWDRVSHTLVSPPLDRSGDLADVPTGQLGRPRRGLPRTRSVRGRRSDGVDIWPRYTSGGGSDEMQ